MGKKQMKIVKYMVEGTGGYQAAEVVIVPPGEVVALASSSNGDHVSSKP